MTPETPRHGAVVTVDSMLTSIQGLTVAVAENNVRLGAVLEDNKEMKIAQEKQRDELSALKVKVYSMAAILSVVSSFITTWIRDGFTP